MPQHSKTEIKSDKTEMNSIASTYLAIVIPKKLENFSVLPLSSYWLEWQEASLPIPELKDNFLSTITEVLSESLLENIWVSSLTDLPQWLRQWQHSGFTHWAEKQFLPGVTDNLAHVVEEAFELQGLSHAFKVASGIIYLAKSPDLVQNAEYRLYHPVVERFQTHSLLDANPRVFYFPAVHLNNSPALEIVDLDKDDEELLAISRERVLALSLDEMRSIKQFFVSKTNQAKRREQNLPVWPTDAELEIIAQTWSEHCKHKIFNANIDFTEIISGKKKIQNIKSLYKSYIQKATNELKAKRQDLLSVFKDNSGVIKWNDKFAVCFKAETHNSPSALEPYGGALTGILGVNRDILGTGLGAKPIFNTDILCFAYPSDKLAVRPKLLPPELIIEGVRKGIQDGGNKSGIPTVNGSIVFDNRYRAKPLVFCGTGGILPLEVAGLCAYEKHTQPGDVIVMAGGQVGKDGIHGATFSSEALHEGSPVTAVQIGDPFTQKRLIDFVLAARDAGLITGITDNGAGGLSSSVGEMATITGGALVNLDKVPTKYPGLAAWEIIVSESQERMTISTNNFAKLEDLAKKFNVEISDIGTFNTSGKFEIRQGGEIIASLDLDFLHDGLAKLNLKAVWQDAEDNPQGTFKDIDLQTLLPVILSHPNVCSREVVIRQYDHEVLGASIIKPLMGKKQIANCDAAVITPVLGDSSGLAISNGIWPALSEFDPYLMAQCALDEAIRNAICVGTNPDTIAILDNFCWPDPVISANNPDGAKYLGMLVKCCQGLYDAAITMETPLISGKDSMKNDFDDGVIRLSIPPTLLVSAIGRVENIENCLSSEFKKVGDEIYLLSGGTLGLVASTLSQVSNTPSVMPQLDLLKAKTLYRQLHKAIQKGLIHSAHDISDGGLLTSICESIIGGDIGAHLEPDPTELAIIGPGLSTAMLLLAEGPGQIVVTVPPKHSNAFKELLHEIKPVYLGKTIKEHELEINLKMTENKTLFKWHLNDLRSAWATPLPFA